MADVSAQTAVQTREPLTDLQTRLLAQKTLLISELAEAIDNHFNNMMMSVTSYAELELKKASSTGRRNLEQVLDKANRAARLMQKLLAFGRTRTLAPRLLEVNELVEGDAELLQQLLGEEIHLELDLQEDLPRVRADAVSLEELLLTLAIHARNAMNGRGKFSLATEAVRVPQDMPVDGTLARGQYVMLSISDSSSAARASSSNDPPASQNLRISLALAAIHAIVRESQGVIRITGEPGRQTKLNIYFPAVEREILTAVTGTIEKSSAAKTILVVDDDDAVRIPAAEFLKMEGFKVLQAKTGPEAIHIASQNRSPLDLLITDIFMPAMSGRQVAKELGEAHPGLKVLFMSGDASESLQMGEDSAIGILHKPFRLDKLNQEIRTLLQE
jgi:CheY-like chemotaxis protein